MFFLLCPSFNNSNKKHRGILRAEYTFEETEKLAAPDSDMLGMLRNSPGI